jgi:hypothetical protein
LITNIFDIHIVFKYDEHPMKKHKGNRDMTEFWETSFLEKQTMWGFGPSDSAILTKDFFLEQKVKDILIPGIGYGRNAKIFHDNGISVTYGY